MAPGDKAPTQVSHAFDHLAREFKLPRQERIEWKGADGVTVEGLLFYPLDYQEGQRYPLCVQTHGGPAASDQLRIRPVAELHPGAGREGLRRWCSPTTGAAPGYGDPFLRDMVGHYYKNSHLDVMAAVDHLIKIGIADPDRMVKMGWSGGGHMTNKIITFTDRFKAASSGCGGRELDFDVRPERRAELPHAVVWRHAVAEERADRPVLEPLSAQGHRERQDPDPCPRR